MNDSTWLHWSGGKDSAYALHKLTQQGGKLGGIVTSLSSEFRRISMHGVREELLEAQAAALRLPLQKILIPRDCNMEDYNSMISEEMAKLKAIGATHCAFGDIFLEDLKLYRQKQMDASQLETVFPIWKENSTATMAKSIIESGVKAVVVCVSGKHFDSSFVGRDYDLEFLNDLTEGVDPCGENGEFHTFVYDSPNFSQPIPVKLGEVVDKLYTPASNQEDEPECGAKPSWDTEFFFQELSRC
ncbi:MAG: ATP-binding protein [Rubritalea sp.]|uniref:Dph6-related ATP pyrophosphatase n=1 Tax=Rubritalea sp. TaxID=2109375 RepID=UPI003242B153